MDGRIFISDSEIGNVDFKIIDFSMGAIGGNFIPTEGYIKFKNEIQKLTDKNGNANSKDFNFRIVVENKELNSVGGICLTDSEEFDEMYLDAAGISQNEIDNLCG